MRSSFIAAAVAACFFCAFSAPADELSDQRAWELIEDLRGQNDRARREAERALIEARDPTLAAALVELLFFRKEARAAANRILEETFDRRARVLRGNTYKDWFEYLGGRTDILPRRGYLEFKASEYARIDPEFAGFLSPEHARTIRPEEIIWGGVRKDGIPALRNPATVRAGEAHGLAEDDVVFGVVVSGEARAYPKRILASHEMANDVLGGETISLAYCTLCGAAIAYATTLGEGETYTFGTSGLLYRSNKLMYDHQTKTLWSQVSGEPVMGPLVGQEKALPLLSLTVSTWGAWKTAHPDTTVLSFETGFNRDYSGSTYADYFASPDLMFPVWKKDDRLEPKDEVYVVRLDGKLRAYPVAELVRAGLVTDEWTEPLTIVADPGGAIRVYRSGAVRFVQRDGATLLTAEGELWTIGEEGLVSAEGEVLERAPGHQAYWFGVYAQEPAVSLWPGRD